MPQESTAGIRVWHRGPPPHIGWWNASVQRQHAVWRWWDGVRWRRIAFTHYSAQAAGIASLRPETYRIESMEWTDYWPEDGRVERINPDTGEVTGRIKKL